MQPGSTSDKSISTFPQTPRYTLYHIANNAINSGTSQSLFLEPVVLSIKLFDFAVKRKKDKGYDMPNVDSEQLLLSAVSANARQLYLLLRCVNFGPHAQVQISSEGLRFSVEESSVMEGITSRDKVENRHSE